MTYQDNTASIIQGLNKAAEIITSTMGAEGKTVAIVNSLNDSLRFTKDGVSVARSIKFDDPYENVGAKILISAANETVNQVGDGPQPLYSKVLTPNGFVTMGSLKKGDVICGTNKTHQTVVDVFPKGEKNIYKVNFMDGRTVECCEDHLWQVTTFRDKVKVLTLKEIIKTGNVFNIKKEGSSVYGFYTPKTVVDFNYKDVLISPYLLGLLLGDGSLSGTGNIELSLGKSKEHILKKLPKDLNYKISYVESKNYYRIKVYGLEDKLKEMGLFGTKSNNKFIPKDYLYNSEQVRLDLLQGLLDTDGYINKRNRFEYNTVSDLLANDFLELTRSLGISTNYKLVKRKGNSYSNVSIHRITELKGYKNGDKIVSIENTGKSTEMQCIKVSNQDSLYITDNYIVTHNTTLTSLILKEMINYLSTTTSNINKTLEELKEDIDYVVQQIKEQKQTITTNEQIKAIATVSSNSEVIGELFNSLYKVVGFDSLIKLENSEYTSDSYFEVTKGIEYQSGYVHPSFMTDKTTETTTFEDALIYISRDNITGVSESYKELIGKVHSQEIPIVIMAPEFSDAFIRFCQMNKINNGVQVVLVRIPGSTNNSKNKNIEDIEAFLSEDGYVEKVVISPYTTTFYNEDTPRLQERIDALRSLKNTSVEWWEEEDYEKRIHKLKGSSAIIYAGGPTKESQSEEFDRIEDAIGATQAAIRNGYVVGGGYTMFNLKAKTEILQNILKQPVYTILDNANVEISTSEIRKGYSNGKLFNVKSKQWEDINTTTIYDPADVLISALLNAYSNSKLITNTSFIINV